MRPEDWILERATLLKAAAQWRDPGADALRASGAGPYRVDARSNDYLGLARSIVSRETVESAVQAGAGASRLISGTLPEHLELEAALAEWLGTESALLFSTGYAANVGAVSALAAPGDTVFSDALNHASLIDGCRLGRARVEVLPHLDLGALQRGLAAAAPSGARWVVTESYFGMDGDVPDLRALRRLCDDYGAGLIVDEAHALGVFGAEGRGLCAEAGVTPDLLIGGMGKGLGVQGGFVAGSSIFRDWLWNRARTFVYSTAPSPLLCRLALQQLARLRGAEAARECLRTLETQLAKALHDGGVVLAAGRRGPLFPIVLGSERAALEAAAALGAQGIACHAIRPPTVPVGASRLRITLRADMTKEQLEYLAAGLLEAWRSIHRPIAEGGVRGAAGPSALALDVAPNDGAAQTNVRGSGASGAEPSAGEGTLASSAPALDPVPADAAGRIGKGGSGESRAGASAAGAAIASSTPALDPAPAEGAGQMKARESGRPGAEPSPIGGALAPWGPGLDVAAVAGARPLSARGSSATAAAETSQRGPSAPRWIVLGTGTGVGKSFVAEALVRRLAARGYPVAGLKPVETGLEAAGANAFVSDAERLERASFHVKHPLPHPLYGFPDPLAPSLAARRVGRSVELGSIGPWLERTHSNHPQRAPALVIETAGGVFSPLSDRHDNLDLAVALGPAEWILVAPDRLGSLHDVLSTLRALESTQRSPDWIVLSAVGDPDASSGTNAVELRRRNLKPPILELGRGETAALEALLGAL